MAFALATLAVGSIFFGYYARDMFIGFGTEFWNGSIYHSTNYAGAQLEGEFLPFYIKLTPLVGSIVALLTVFFVNSVQLGSLVYDTYLEPRIRALHRFLSHK
jgi:hypothetical protein